MKQGFILPGGTAPEQVELAVLAEQAGWDAVFTWEGGYAVDPWCTMSAMAMRTERVRLGTMLTPVPWRRPWKLAGQVATLDQLSDGRAILAAGVGAVDPGLGTYPDVTDLRERAALLDVGIDTMRALWSGEVVAGEVDLTKAFRKGPQPVQARIPIWVVAIPGKPKSMRRALRCDGVMTQSDPEKTRSLLAWLDDNGGRPSTFDVVAEGETTPEDASAMDEWRGLATWWLESRWMTDDPAVIRTRIEAGPVR